MDAFIQMESAHPANLRLLLSTANVLLVDVLNIQPLDVKLVIVG